MRELWTRNHRDFIAIRLVPLSLTDSKFLLIVVDHDITAANEFAEDILHPPSLSSSQDHARHT